MTIFKYTMKKVINYIIIFFLLVVGLLIGSSNNALLVNADVIAHTDVLDDLKKDNSFDVSNYPIMTYNEFVENNKDDDPTNDKELINVIHIGESDEKELYVYTYQPIETNYSLTAKYLTMSVGENSLDYNKYDLKLVSTNSVFKKYKLINYLVSNDVYRYYNISEIERPFDSLIDTKISDETITDYKTHAVGQTWCCYYKNDTIIYEAETLQYVEIQPTINDYIYYDSGFSFSDIVGVKDKCRSYYIAFNVNNFDVTKIYDADLTYKYLEVKYNYAKNMITKEESYHYKNESGTWIDEPWTDENFLSKKVTLKETDKTSYKGEGLWAKEYNWDRIMKADEFVSRLEEKGGTWGTTTKETLLNSQWVFAFSEYAYQSYSQISGGTTTGGYEGTLVKEVDILRLHFASKQGTYNLGVVGDTTTADNIPGGNANGIDEKQLTEWFEKILMLIGIILLCTILNFVTPIFSVVFNVLGKCLKWILKGLILVITAPFKLIGSLFKKRR